MGFMGFGWTMVVDQTALTVTMGFGLTMVLNLPSQGAHGMLTMKSRTTNKTQDTRIARTIIHKF